MAGARRRSSGRSPSPAAGAKRRQPKDGAAPSAAAARPAISAGRAAARVCVWYCITLASNYVCQLLCLFKDHPSIDLQPGDITITEALSCTICGALTLFAMRLPLTPPPAVRTRLLLLGLANASACRFFMMAADLVPLSLLQTVRSCQPLFTVVLVFLAFNERYSLATYATLLPISLGFSLAAGGDPGFEQTVRSSHPHPWSHAAQALLVENM